MIVCLLALAGMVSAPLAFSAGPEQTDGRKPASFFEKRFSINFRNASLKEALQLIAAKGDMTLKIQNELDGKVNYAFKDATLEDALEKIAENNNLDYKISNGTIIVAQQSEEDADSETGESTPSSSLSGSAYHALPVYYSSARELAASLQKNLRKGESITVDEENNVLVLYGPDSTYMQIKNFIAIFDKRPLQILIEAQIVETSRTFARDLGISWGDAGAAAGEINVGTIGVVNPAPTGANLILRGLLGSIDGRALEARLLAAESSGQAKIISHPQVFTLNNRKATIHSGITYNIRTLSATTTGSGGSGGASGGTGTATGGLKQISAGIQLDVTPTVVGDGLVRLAVKVTDSAPTAASVDGIPGINDNSADSSILVKAGQTATLAGLMKNDSGTSQTGPPWLSKIPVIGWLFQSHSNHDNTSEVMMFITPHVVDPLATRSAASTTSNSIQVPPVNTKK